MKRSALYRFFKLPVSEKIVTSRIFFLLVFFKLLILLFPFKRIGGYLGVQGKTSPEETGSETDEFVVQMVRYIRTISRRLPWKSTCLIQAATGKVMLNQRKIECTVYFGVKKNIHNKMEAHAWLRVGNKIVLGGETATHFVPVATFS